MEISQAIKNAVILRALRNAFGLSQSDLAEMAKCSRPTINRIESLDKSSPRSDTVDDLFQVFRRLGVELQIGDEEVLVRFTKSSLSNAALKIRGPEEPERQAEPRRREELKVKLDPNRKRESWEF